MLEVYERAPLPIQEKTVQRELLVNMYVVAGFFIR